MSLSGFLPEVRSRPGMSSEAICCSVVGSISRIVKPWSPPHSPTMRCRESKAMVAHSETPYDAERTCRSLPSGPLTS